MFARIADYSESVFRYFSENPFQKRLKFPFCIGFSAYCSPKIELLFCEITYFVLYIILVFPRNVNSLMHEILCRIAETLDFFSKIDYNSGTLWLQQRKKET